MRIGRCNSVGRGGSRYGGGGDVIVGEYSPRHVDGIQVGAHHPRTDDRQSRSHQMLLVVIIEIEEGDG